MIGEPFHLAKISNESSRIGKLMEVEEKKS